jgi:hypothetical protein
LQHERADLDYIGLLNSLPAADTLTVDVDTVCRAGIFDYNVAIVARESRVVIGNLQAVQPDVVVTGTADGKLRAIVECNSRKQL